MDLSLVGKKYPIFIYEVGSEKIIEYAKATLSKNPYSLNRSFAKTTQYKKLIAPPTFVATYAFKALRYVFDDKDLGMYVPNVMHAEQTFEFGEIVKSGDIISTKVELKNGFTKENKNGNKIDFLVVISESKNQRKQIVCNGRWVLVEKYNV
tara:strand:- start:192 stop:644 length:453 start_codon:yes stop_codon:yes gene_type:complete